MTIFNYHLGNGNRITLLESVTAENDSYSQWEVEMMHTIKWTVDTRCKKQEFIFASLSLLIFSLWSHYNCNCYKDQC